MTLDQLNSVLPSQEVSPDQIEDTMSMLSDMGITVVESEEAEEGAAAEKDSADDAPTTPTRAARAVVAPSLPATTSARAEPTDRTDDPVRMYLRDMGSVELLSREGEIAIAKRIEAGREAMIAGLCESPLTFQAIIIWRDELNSAKLLLRDIIDLEATYEGPEAKNAPPPMRRRHRGAGAGSGRAAASGDGESGEPRPEGEMDDEDDFENAMSLAAMEAELKPKVLETFDNIAGAYKKLGSCRTSASRCTWRTSRSRASSRRPTTRSRDEIIKDVKSLSLNNARIEMLVEQLYKINRNLVQLESRLMRLADSYGVPRQNFIDEYFGNELDQTWIERMAALRQPQVGAVHQAREGSRSPTSARRSRRWPRRRGSRSPSSAASSRPCRRASARRARPRRRWWRPTCASSSPLPRSTPTAACSSWT